jgi:chromosome partitioning protein
MTSILAVANIAGGTYKTTSAHSLSVAAVEYGKKVLLIDLDPRAELTFNVGFEKSRLSMVDLLNGSTLGESNDITTVERFDFLGTDSRLASISDTNGLKVFLSSLPDKYDLVIIDTPAHVDSRLAMALVAADSVVIPTGASIHSMRGAINTGKIQSLARKFILPCDQLSKNHIEQFTDVIVLDALIPSSTGIDNAISEKRSVLSVDKSSDFAQAFREAAYSLLEHLKFF